ncbi:matrix metalloproteinase-18 [Lingula anatina]|uniref:Matrix metalloproteinase-18 n=1 Tax=Lingula anatina TaxID=7574 RepID=A0A1S3HK05_LINAN|nr:matrix metalloproteinase-18 [Lingula anatina]|eukprot:XP_013385786.1 matrix metalloproteinase-18 [Lingula anatina]
MLPFSVSREFLVFFVPLLLTCSVFAGNRGVVPQRKKDDTDSSPWELGGTYYKHARTKITTTQDAANYLWEYGYMTERDIRRFESLSNSEATRFVNSKLMRFQTMGNIRAKGSLDRNTIALMNQPRCGNKDTERPIRNNIPLKLSCIREKAVVTYAVMSYTRDLPQHTVQTEIARAFEEWSDVISITFEETNGTSDIEINFVDGFHTYSPMFDGAGGTVAKAMFDLTGQGGECGTIYIDEGELWTKQSPRGLDLYTVMVHEIGHLIGLTHSADPDSIMWPWFDTKTTLEDLKARRRQKLDVVIDSDRRHPAASVKQMAARQHTASAQRDEVAVQPENDVQNTESHKWTENNSVLQTNILNVGRGPELLNGVTVCPSAIDAITVAANGKTYAFKDGNVYMLNKSTFGIEDGFPRPIASVFGDNAPGRVDAAVTLYYYGVPFTYLFQVG